MTTLQLPTSHRSQYFAWLLARRAAGDSVESLTSTLVDSQVDRNPHQVEAARFACRNLLSRDVILADEVGPGKTIEAGLVISERWAERRRKVIASGTHAIAGALEASTAASRASSWDATNYPAAPATRTSTASIICWRDGESSRPRLGHSTGRVSSSTTTLTVQRSARLKPGAARPDGSP